MIFHKSRKAEQTLDKRKKERNVKEVITNVKREKGTTGDDESANHEGGSRPVRCPIASTTKEVHTRNKDEASYPRRYVDSQSLDK